MRILLAYVFFFCSYAFSQDTIYYYGINGRILDNEDQAIIQKEVKRRFGNCYRIQVRDSSADEWVPVSKKLIRVSKSQDQMVRIWEDAFFPVRFKRSFEPAGSGVYYFEERRRDKLLRSGYTSSRIPLSLEGEVREYYQNGTLKSESVYHQNMLVSNRNYYPDGTEYIHDIFYSSDQPPLYSGGNLFFRNFIITRINQYEIPVHDVNDVVVIGAVILETGELTGVRLVKGRLPDINEFFLESIELLPGSWTPAFLNGEPVRYFIELTFNLSKNVPLLQDLEFTKSGHMFWNY